MIDEDPLIDPDVAPAEEELTPVEIGYCRQCGYDMRGLGVDVCPECGTRFDAELTRELNRRWCLELVQGMRVAHLVTAVGCGIALLHLLTGGLNGPVLVIFGMLALGLVTSQTIVLMMRRGNRLSGQGGGEVLNRCGSTFALIGMIVVGLPLVFAGRSLGVSVMLVAALLFTAIQGQRYFEGRRRGYLFGVSSAVAESVGFAVGVSKFFGVMTVILLVAVLATQ